MTRDRTVHFKDIPKTSALFLDFLHDFSKIPAFFPSPYSLEHFRKEGLMHSCHLAHRKELCEILETQNRAFGAGERTLEQIQKLRDSDCWAVVTGQQVGLFTGPAYTVYKALTAVKLAAHYACRGVKVVPVFWMATEDHDLAEVDHCYLVDADSQPRQIRYETGSADQARSVGGVNFSDRIQATLSQFLEILPDSEFRQEFQARLTETYASERSFASAFGGIFSYLFSNYGLILLDPQSGPVKTLAKPVLDSILLNSENFHRLIDSQSQRLVQCGYHAQVIFEDEALGLFFEDDGKRRALVRESKGVRVRGTETLLSTNQWRSRIQETPGKFSPNVLFRPILQDYLLPTLACVAGPSEIAYLAQVGPLYAEFGKKAPIVFPRFSFSIIERKIAKILDKYRLQFADVFLGSEALIKKIIEESVDRTLAAKFTAIESEFVQKLGELESSLRAIDHTLAEALKTTQQKVQYQVSHLRTKFVNAEAKHQEVLTKQVERVLSILYPLKTLQERRINIFYFLSRYGMDFLAQLYEEIDLTDPDHRLFFVA
jgi:bacillithiol synthase